jgi:hypothetical protein
LTDNPLCCSCWYRRSQSTSKPNRLYLQPSYCRSSLPHARGSIAVTLLSSQVTRQSLKLVTEYLQLHRTLTATYSRYFTAAFTPVVPIAVPVLLASRIHSTIPKVGHGIPTIAPDAHGCYSRSFTAALTLVVPIAAIAVLLASQIHSTIPKVGHGIPTIAPDANGSLL